MHKHIRDYIDDWGLVCTLEANGARDGGDTCANEFTILYCQYAGKQTKPTKDQQAEMQHKLRAVYDAPSGLYVRHPDPAKWYSDTDRFSRDQMRPLLYFLGLNVQCKSAKAHKQNLFKAHAKRGFLFTWNTKRNFQYGTEAEHKAKSTPDVAWDYGTKTPDFTGPEVWASWLRAWRVWPLWPVLWLLDLQLLINTILTLGNPKTDMRNHALGTDFAARIMPTPVSLLNKHIYRCMKPQKAFKAFWEPIHEPPIDVYLNRLYK